MISSLTIYFYTIFLYYIDIMPKGPLGGAKREWFPGWKGLEVQEKG